MTKNTNESVLSGTYLNVILSSLRAVIEPKALKQLSVIVPAKIVMTGRITMLGISRWCEKGGSYRSVQRFFNTKLLWDELQWSLIKGYLIDKEDVYLLAGDEVVVTKSGKKSYGLDRFFSSLQGKAVKSLCFFSLSLIGVKKRQSYPLLAKQVIRTKTTQGSKKSRKVKLEEPIQSLKKRGRPKGSKTKDKDKPELSSYLCFVKGLVAQVLSLVRPLLKIDYLVLEGAYGTNEASQLAKHLGLCLISKLKSNSALFFPAEARLGKIGAKQIYGLKLNYQSLPNQYRQSSLVTNTIQTDTYQMTLRHKLFSQPLNIVLILKTNLKSKAKAHILLFSTDLSLDADKLIDYYSLRFQIEFNFRDAKQFWGLEDFMSIRQLPIHNAANLSLFMINVSKALCYAQRSSIPLFSVIDLKAHSRALRYAFETLKLLPQILDPFLIDHLLAKLPPLGAIRRL